MKRERVLQYYDYITGLVIKFKDIFKVIDKRKVHAELVTQLEQLFILVEQLATEIKRTGTDDTKTEVENTLS